MYYQTQRSDLEQYIMSKSEIISKYLSRDVEMKLTGSVYFNKHLTKLGYTQEAINKNKENMMREFLHKELDKIIDSENYYQFETLMNKWLNSNQYLVLENEKIMKQQRYQELLNFMETTNEEFYNQLTLEELIYLGY